MDKNINEAQEQCTIHSVSKRLLLSQLDKWIGDCETQAEIFRENKLSAAEISSQGMAQAYWNVKQFIDINIKETTQKFTNHPKCKLDRNCHRNLNKDCNYYCEYFNR